jgi:hypothetical protein
VLRATTHHHQEKQPAQNVVADFIPQQSVRTSVQNAPMAPIKPSSDKQAARLVSLVNM